MDKMKNREAVQKLVWRRERERPQKSYRDKIPDQGYQGQEQVREDHSGDNMGKGEHQRDEEDKSEKQDNVQRLREWKG